MNGWHFGAIVAITSALLCFKIYDRKQSDVEEIARINAQTAAVKEVSEVNQRIVDLAHDYNKLSSELFLSLSESSEKNRDRRHDN